MVGCGPEAVNAVAEIDAREVAREDLLLGQPGLQPEGDDDLLCLALDGAVAREEVRLCQLLRDRASALAHTTAAQVGNERPSHAARIDAPMPVEAPILYGDERCRGERIELRHIDRRLLYRTAQGNRMPVIAHQQHGRVRKRFE